eukprot:scaffold1808_cov158-Amphora_coffeaeformis.AAC.12
MADENDETAPATTRTRPGRLTRCGTCLVGRIKNIAICVGEPCAFVVVGPILLLGMLTLAAPVGYFGVRYFFVEEMDPSNFRTYIAVVTFSSFGWTCAWFYGVINVEILSLFFDKGPALAVASLTIIVCWIIGYFVARHLRKLHVERTFWNGYEWVLENPGLDVPTPCSDYRIPLFGILKNILFDFVMLVYILLKILLTIPLVIAYALTFGMYYTIMKKVVVDWLGPLRLMDNQYAVSGQRIQGQIVSPLSYPLFVVVHYSPFVGSPFLYEKKFKTNKRYGRLGECSRFVEIPFPESDSIDLYILPHNPRSARPVVEVANRNEIYRMPTCGLIMFDLIFLAFCLLFQTFHFSLMLTVFLFRTELPLDQVPTQFPLVLLCYVLVGLSSSYALALIVWKKRENSILNDAKEVERPAEAMLPNLEEDVEVEFASWFSQEGIPETSRHSAGALTNPDTL